ncbi:MAG: hypothetical protein F6K40_17515 [Okeania sp. SIO3I5]|nr:hypothetical protein [Okeania sp. SIO3I5]
MPNKALDVLRHFDKVVDLYPLNNAKKDDYIDNFGNLSEIYWVSIESNVLSWLE